MADESSTEQSETVEAARDFQQEIRFLRDRMTALARGRYPDELDDIAHEAWIRLHRALQRESAQNLEALMTRIAWRSWVDFCRKRATERRVLGTPVAVEETSVGEVSDAPTLDLEALESWRFAVCEWFAEHRPPCLAIVGHVFAGRSWNEASRELGERPNTLAKRWQRCREQFLELARRDRGPLRRVLDALVEFE